MAQSNPHQNLELLEAFRLGKLAGSAADTVALHLETCDDCRRVVAAPAVAVAAPAAVPVADPIPPALASNPDYEIIREISRGGMGVVYLARNKRMDRLEGLKVVNESLLKRSGALERFEREMRSAGRLNHQNIVTAYSSPPLEGLLSFAMEFVDGTDLHQLVVERGPLPVSNACYYIYQTALGLQHAHDRQMVHRDIKPNNLMLTRDGKKQVIKILDFGLAKATSENQIDAGLTRDGQMLGTPSYMAPEQIVNAAKADIRADIYSLGCTLYYLLTGDPPFARKGSLWEIFESHRSEIARPLNELRSDVPAELAAIVARMLSKNPDERYQQPSEVAQALAPYFKQGVKPIPAGDGRFTISSVATTPTATTSSKVAAPTRPPTPTPAPVAPAAIPENRERASLTAGDKVEPNPSQPLPGRITDSAQPRQIKRSDRGETRRLLTQAMPLKIWIGVAAGILLLGTVGLWAGGVFSTKVKTKEGQESIVTARPDRAQDRDKTSADEFRKDPELQRLEAADENSDVPDLPAGDLDANAPEIEPVEIKESVPFTQEEGFVSLFNGKDLTGWRTHPSQPGNWRVENGLLVGSGPPLNHLYTVREDFSDFHLRLEARANDGANSGVFFRAPFGPKHPPVRPVGPLGYQAKIHINSKRGVNKTGSLSVDGAWITAFRELLTARDAWFTMEVIAEGQQIVVKVNGRTTAEYSDDQRRYSRGCLALQVWKETTVEFRKIEIREGKPTAVAVLPETAVNAVESVEEESDDESRPAERLKSAITRHEADVKKAEKALASQFDKEIDAVSRGKLKPDDRIHLVEVLKSEKAAFDTRKLIPWSQPMRASVLAYLRDLMVSDAAITKAYDRQIAAAIRAKDDNKVESLQQELRSVAPRRLLAKWNCTGVTFKNSWNWGLYSDGTFDLNKRRPGPGDEWVWAFDGKIFVVKTRHAKDPRDQFVDRCLIAIDGSAFTAENNKKQRFAGKIDRSGN